MAVRIMTVLVAWGHAAAGDFLATTAPDPDVQSDWNFDSLPPRALQYVVAFTPYFDYKGPLNVSGSVSVEGAGLLKSATQTVAWQLKGVDPGCETVPEGVKNACGIHIHEGKSCYADAGGHYWNTSLFEVDPWATVAYKTETFKSYAWSSETGVAVATGLTNYEVLGHTVIVHDHTGARVACGVITPQRLTVNALVSYFDYKGPLHVSGSVLLKAQPPGVDATASQAVSWSLKGVDAKCKSGAGAEPNSCGVHIHEGMSCTENALGHYWNRTTYQADPWSPIHYTSRSFAGQSVPVAFTWWKSWPVTTGLEMTDVNGHTMIVHDYEGARVACGIISPHAEVANAFVPYYSYKGALAVAGWVKVLGKGALGGASQELSWSLEGVDPACGAERPPSENPNACGVAIHQGMDCTADAMGHYFGAGVEVDPWTEMTAVKYQSNKRGRAAANGIVVITGLSNFDVLGHTVVVHDSTGGRIACGILNIASH